MAHEPFVWKEPLHTCFVKTMATICLFTLSLKDAFDFIYLIGIKPGGVAILERNGRFIYYLITKVTYSDKPTYDSLRSSLESMKEHCLKHKVKHLAMPRIGCGLDLLKWEEVSVILIETFHDTDVAITVYSL